MANKYLAFDIETAKDIPGDDFNWRPHRPLGITCAATLASDRDMPELWFGKQKDGTPAPQMSCEDVNEFVKFLCKAASEGYRVLSWNGLGFDFDVIAEECGEIEDCKEVALDHIDMMFHLVCCLGYPVSLAKAAQGMGVAGKPVGMSGEKAPTMWAEGRHQEVLDYVAQDVRIALELAVAVEARRRFQWITARGVPKSIPLPRGWLCVRESLLLPEPDTSWMKSRLSRRDFMPWIKGR